MAAQNGKDLLIKVDLSGAGQFETMAGLRSTRIAFNAETVDVTSLESEGGWRELLGGAFVCCVILKHAAARQGRGTHTRAPQ